MTIYTKADGTLIDFSGSEFNRIDDLQDYFGNYRLFQSLDGVVTADMLHQREQEKDGAGDAAEKDRTTGPTGMPEGGEREAAGAVPPHNPNSGERIIFLKESCLHGRSRTIECRQCLEACPVHAVQSLKREIVVNHDLCDGCGGCALACPVDAFRMVKPSCEELLEDLRDVLEKLTTTADPKPVLVISDDKNSVRDEASGGYEGNHNLIIPFPVPKIGYAGLEILLTAFAYGADRVVVSCSKHTPASLVKAVAWQIEMAGAILDGLNVPSNTLRFVVRSADDNHGESLTYPALSREGMPDNALIAETSFSLRHDKRTLVRMAAQRLYDRAGVNQPLLPLPPGSPFGTVTVDPRACTLCMACVVVCSYGALSAGGSLPRIEIMESSCRQCGLCEEVCPEGALRLLPRLLCDTEKTGAPTTLHEAEAARCIVCGVPFAAQTMIDRMQAKLRGHWMYGDDRQRRRLRMCRTCRARDALTSHDGEMGNRP